MKIIKLTRNAERQLLQLREVQDQESLHVAARIVADVRRRGDAALNHWTRKFDRRDVAGNKLWVSKTEFARAGKRASADFLKAIEHAANNVRCVARQQLPKEWKLQVEPGIEIGQMVRPIERIGCYIPGGRFALVSTLVMTVVPAQVAGVKELVAVCPAPDDELLAAAALLGVEQLAVMGGAQSIAALAYGTKRIERVEKIFGPGNRFVTAAKQIVSTDCAIDLPAGPTEAVVLADSGNPGWIAADMLAQAEHAPDAGGYLVTTSLSFAKRVQKEIQAQLKNLPASNPAHSSTRRTGAILLAASKNDALSFVNRFAPEHLSLPEGNEDLLDQIQSAGTVFVGGLSAQPFGDYATGSNHVLPTGGWARRRGGLSTSDFVKRISVQRISEQGFSNLAADVQTLARAEGLIAHANAVEVRR